VEKPSTACSLYRLAGTAARRGALSCHTERTRRHSHNVPACQGLNEPARGRCNATDCGGVEGASVCSRCSRIGLKVAGLSEIRAAGEEKWRVRLAFLYVVGVEELLLATPHSNLGQSLCTCLVGWYPPSRGGQKQLLLRTPHLGVQGGGGSKELETREERERALRVPTVLWCHALRA